MAMEQDIHEADTPAQAGGGAAMRASIRLRTVEPAQAGFLARLWRGARAPLAAKRDRCIIVAVLMVLDRRLALDGLITSLGPSSVVFRQASTFIFDRTGAEVSIRFDEHELRGRITGFSVEGYVVSFTEPLPQLEVGALIAAYGRPD